LNTHINLFEGESRQESINRGEVVIKKEKKKNQENPKKKSKISIYNSFKQVIVFSVCSGQIERSTQHTALSICTATQERETKDGENRQPGTINSTRRQKYLCFE
jgi:hypothetical protein